MTPVDERLQPSYTPATGHYPPQVIDGSEDPHLPGTQTDSLKTANEADATVIRNPPKGPARPSEKEGTAFEEGPDVQPGVFDGPGDQTSVRRRQPTMQTINSSTTRDHMSSLRSPTQTREESTRLLDELRMLQVQRQISGMNSDREDEKRSIVERFRARREDLVDDFDVATNPLHEKATLYQPPTNPENACARFFKKVHQKNYLVRYFVYIIPVVLILLIPLLLGAFVFKDASVGGVRLVWFSTWLELVWLTLWAGRILAKMLPYPFGLITSIWTNNSKKWRDMGKQLEMPATLCFWWLGIEISFLPTMVRHHVDGGKETRHWETVMNKVLVSIFVGVTVNLALKITIQLIAIAFNLRTYEDRIVTNKFQIESLIKLYEFSEKNKTLDKSQFEQVGSSIGSGHRTPRTPKEILELGQRKVKGGLIKLGDVAGKVAADFTGKQATTSTHPRQFVIDLLAKMEGCQTLARSLYRTFVPDGRDVICSADIRPAFDNDEDAEAAFAMFDKDMNGDVAMEELEAVCTEIGRERKSITASLKDLDSVIGKLDDVFVFIVVLITVLVFISLISTSAAGAITSAGSTILALSWLLSATAQEFLQSIIFVFVKHPFDVGDRVTIYGNTGAMGKGDDYFVKEISLLYTEFKKMEGHLVQAPNSVLNSLFILNQRRSGALAEAVPIIVKFGTTLAQINGLRTTLVEFVSADEQRREFQPRILTELREITEAHSITLNIVFFYKSNWQNEIVRLQRRNRFICAVMMAFHELGIEGPRMRLPGQKDDIPLYTYDTTPLGEGASYVPHRFLAGDHRFHDPPVVAPIATPHTQDARTGNTNDVLLERLPSGDLGTTSSAGAQPPTESLSEMGRRIDLSLGMRDAAFGGDMSGDVYADRERDSNVIRNRIPLHLQSPSETGGRQSAERGRNDGSTGHELGRTTSRASLGSGMLGRITTNNMMRSPGSVHKNRFFGWGPERSVDEEKGDGSPIGRVGSASFDISASRRQEMQHLAQIAEAPGGSGTQSVNLAEKDRAASEKRGSDDAEKGVHPAIERLNPRSAPVSPQAWRSNTDDSIQPKIEPWPLRRLPPAQQRRSESDLRSLR